MNASRPLSLPFPAWLWQVVTIGDRLGRRAAIVLWLAAAIGVGLFSGWRFVVAAGLSTIVLSLLPCAAMCALGLCAGSPHRKCSHDTSPSKENRP